MIRTTIAAIRDPDQASRDAARTLQSCLTKPAGALGRLEELHAFAAGVLREPAPALDRKVIVVAAADHGVAADGVSAYPRDVTAQMLQNFLVGGAAVNVLAAHATAEVRIVDAGVLRDTEESPSSSTGRRPGGGVITEKLRPGTDNMTLGPAMPRSEAETLIARGIALARDECGRGARAIGLGDMGIGNTTAAAAITAVLTGTPPRTTAGRGTGIDDPAFAGKIAAIERALAVNEPDALDPIDVAAKVGGCEIAFLAGVAIGAAASGAIVVLDGYPTTAAALIAAALAPACVEYMLASHLSAEPGHRIALEHLGLAPVLDLGLRLGEGTGAALAMTILDAALRLPREMATFDAAGVSRSASERRPEP
ncbi:MAG: nicotinate-nucleotide--dimethylbenzimidazole phosphoribosyltransferase [Chloroflexi bacterium]|nr:nicotinate-nucleotide--dimethylbenzimidazole phosphoribosyltransferase [Chloroflexota bacterium]